MRVIGYSRTPLSDEGLRERLRPHLAGAAEEVGAFLARCSYVTGSYGAPEGFQELDLVLRAREAASTPVGRLYYLALPPSVYPEVCFGLKVPS